MNQPALPLTAPSIQPPLYLHTLPTRLQTIITILLTHQEHICHYQQGTLIVQFEKERLSAKLTSTLPL
jgi:hypothetical protein